MSKVKLLDTVTINKIAAGEVVERPASCVKELVENAIDAGANRIEIEIIDVGKTLIRVTDNGVGMTTEDAALALRRHATSKLSNVEDLENISTLGFRG
ncbi:MAG: ATP-binding protein, partial [Selenomonadaceae bacterium]|nr:ATP-binding protein [Selenomonadaceae bacterium]